MAFTLAFQYENRPPPVFESMFMIHFRRKVAKNDISKCTQFCLQYINKTDPGLSISISKLCSTGHPHLLAVVMHVLHAYVSFEVLWDALVVWLMILVAENIAIF